jgi:hypothetical protein
VSAVFSDGNEWLAGSKAGTMQSLSIEIERKRNHTVVASAVRQHYTKNMNHSQYDPEVLMNRAERWRREAALVTLEGVSEFCLVQAEACEKRVHQSLTAPVFRDGARFVRST